MKLGFKYKILNKRKVLLESLRYQVWRYKYITALRKARCEGRSVIYLDETLYNTHDTIKTDRLDCSCSCDLDVPSSRGKGVIIVNAGSENGWVENVLMLLAKDPSADSPCNMNANLFEKWFLGQLLPNISNNSIIVMDNASYHSRLTVKVPTKSAKKSEILEFMKVHNITIPNPIPTKPILVDIVKKSGIERKYFIDELAMSKGFEIVRLPPYHCIFNPIEQVWNKVKHDIRVRNGKPTDTPAICQIIREVMKDVTVDKWKRYIDHAIEEENQYFGMDSEHDNDGSFIINTGGNDSDTSSDDE